MSTTPAMKRCCPSVIPEAVRNSVSMRSVSTGARAGISTFNSDSEAVCQAVLSCARRPVSASAMSIEKPSVRVRWTRRRVNESGSVKVDNSALQGGRRGLGAVGDAQLAQQAIDMGFDGRLGDEEYRADLLIALAGDDLLQHVRLSRGELMAAHAP